MCGLAFVFMTVTMSAGEESLEDLAELSLEELMGIKVSLVSRKAETLSTAAAAVYVISREDIRRSGATSIAEALRLVPGLQVARIDANKWAISARGFNDRYANKLLVQIDGRSVYTPLFSGVYWDVQDVLLEDVAQIEVIRGSGATLWGANAVNGIINVVTETARNTRGGLVETGGGSEEWGFASLRYGGQTGKDTHFRVYGKIFKRDQFVNQAGEGSQDGWTSRRGGFRLDRETGSGGSLTLQGDLYHNHLSSSVRSVVPEPPYRRVFVKEEMAAGFNILGRWGYALSSGSELTLQAYFDRTVRQTPTTGETRNTGDLDLQHWFRWGERQEIIWGMGFRNTSDVQDGSFAFSFDPDRRAIHRVSTFVQDKITLADRLSLTVGSKFGHNSSTGLEIQPSGRLLWTPHRSHTLWGAVSRAVRTPSRVEDDVRLVAAVIPPLPSSPEGPLTFVTAFGNPAIKSEELRAVEFGYRFHPAPAFSFDLAAFYNRYDRLLTFKPGTPFFGTTAPPHLVVPLIATGGLEGDTYGIETTFDWQLSGPLRLRAAYTYLTMQIDVAGEDPRTVSVGLTGVAPQHEIHLRPQVDLPGQVELDAGLRYVSELRNLQVAGYLELDSRLGWRLGDEIELSIVGRNLLHPQHTEFIPPNQYQATPVGVQREVYARWAWRF